MRPNESNVVVLHPEQDLFDEFWKIYPKKFAKAMAKAKWDLITGPNGLVTRSLDRDSGTYVSLTLKATPEEIIEGAKRYRAANLKSGGYGFKDDGKYICHPATWLNQGRWMD